MNEKIITARKIAVSALTGLCCSFLPELVCSFLLLKGVIPQGAMAACALLSAGIGALAAAFLAGGRAKGLLAGLCYLILLWLMGACTCFGGTDVRRLLFISAACAAGSVAGVLVSAAVRK